MAGTHAIRASRTAIRQGAIIGREYRVEGVHVLFRPTRSSGPDMNAMNTSATIKTLVMNAVASQSSNISRVWCSFSHAQGSRGAVVTLPFVWRGHAKNPATRTEPFPESGLRWRGLTLEPDTPDCKYMRDKGGVEITRDSSARARIHHAPARTHTHARRGVLTFTPCFTTLP